MKREQTKRKTLKKVEAAKWSKMNLERLVSSKVIFQFL